MGFDLVDEHLLRVINSLVLFFQSKYGICITLGKAIGAVFAIFVAAGEAYKVIGKHQAFDILAILRPIAFALLLSQWTLFTTAIASPVRLLESYGKDIFDTQHREIIQMREMRTREAEAVIVRTREMAAASEIAKEQTVNQGVLDKIMAWGEEMLDYVKEQVASYGTIWQAAANEWLEGWVMKIGEFFWQIQVYLLFFMKEAFAGIMVITGPITFGLSVLPTWKDAWSQWVARYLSLLLYGFVGYLVLAASIQIMKYGINHDILVLQTANSTSEAFAAYSSSSMATALFHFVTLIVGGLAIKWIPELVTFIIPSSPSHAAAAFVRGAMSQMKSGVNTAVNLATRK